MPEQFLDAIQVVCERLSERSASLFLGAGINAGLTDGSIHFPLGMDLAATICRDLLNKPSLNLALDDAADIARHSFGAKVLNQYLYDLFSRFAPGVAHLALLQLPWDTIYTTNYDLLVEQAGSSTAITPAGRIAPIISLATDLSSYSEEDILYYKLHGSVDIANTPEGRLILTKADYRHYQEHRRPLFKRLQKDLLSRTLVFVGYRLADPDFREILDDCRDVLGIETLPRSYAVFPEFDDVQATFWREVYNVNFVKLDAISFLTTLKDTWLSGYRVVPFEEREARVRVEVDRSARFERITDSFYRIRDDEITGTANAKAFFLGSEPTWADIRDKVGPPRELYDTIFEAIFDELSRPEMKPAAYLVTGPAGTGKTTLLRSICFAIEKEFGLPVLAHIPGTPLDARSLAPLIDRENLARITLLVNHAAENARFIGRFLEDARNQKMPVTLLLEERKNQWNAVPPRLRENLQLTEFELGSVSAREIDRILDALNRHDALGKLRGTDRDYQRQHFTDLADRELLVALRQLTSLSSFDDIIRDEYKKIPSVEGRSAYVYVAALGQIDLPVRYETLINLLHLGYQDLRSKVFLPTEGILVSLEEAGRARHSAGFRVRARHPVIASIVFDHAAPTEEDKFQIISSIIRDADPGHIEDQRMLDVIVRRKELVSTLAIPENRRAVFDLLSRVLPGNPYVLQHRSILEKDLRNPDLAVKYARDAVKADPRNAVVRNTLGLSLEYAARSTSEPMKKQALLSEASAIFTEELRRDRTDQFAYLGQVYIKRHYVQMEADPSKRLLLQADILSLLQEADEMTGSSPVISAELGIHQQQMGDLAEAIKAVKAGLESDPQQDRLRELLVKYTVQNGEITDGLRIAMEGVQHTPTSWRMNRRVAQLKARTGEAVTAVKPYYETAIRFQKNDIGLRVEYGAYLFRSGEYAEAHTVFSDAQNLPSTGTDRKTEREWWLDASGKRRQFAGRVKDLAGAGGFIRAIPENFEAYFFRTGLGLENIRVGAEVQFYVAFSVRGAVARLI